MKIEYPKWLYHRTEAARIVEDPAEHEALGAGWAESPTAFDAAEEAAPVLSAHNGLAPVRVETKKRGKR